MALAFAGPVMAQDYADILKEDTVTSGRVYSVTAAPGQTGITPLTVRVPVANDEGPAFGVLKAEPPAEGGMVAFTFHDAQNQLIESVSLSQAILPTDLERNRRLEVFGALLQRDVLPVITATYPDATTDGARPTKIGTLAAIEILGDANHPTEGPLRWRIVGVVHPDQPEGVYALIQVATDRMPLSSADDFAQSLSGRMLRSIEFQ